MFRTIARNCRWQLPVVVRSYCKETTAMPLRSKKGKAKSGKAVPMVDALNVRAIGGSGGDGCISFLQLWSNEAAGPDGGDGGSGGHVVLEANANVRDLNHLASIIKAQHGEKGYNKDCHGKNAPHTIIKVPLGTVVKNSNGAVLGDLSEEGSMFILARGGAGGHGNHFFTSDTLQAPEIAEYGAKGEDINYFIEVRSIANFGLLGLPNAGKSTLLQAISRARPKVAPYPFTTLAPHLGIVPYSDYEQIAVADLPGIIEDSHKNRGLGIQFLRHAERCTALLLVVDVTHEPLLTVELLRREISLYKTELASKQQVIVANKIDLLDSQEVLNDFKTALKDDDIIPISAKYGTNITTLLHRLKQIYDFNKNNDKETKHGDVIVG